MKSSSEQNVKKTETEEDNEISEDEDPMMMTREAKDWKVRIPLP